MMKNYLLIFIILIALPFAAQGQKLGIKTNTLYWASATPNLGVEMPLSPKITLNITGGLNLFNFGSEGADKKIQHWSVNTQLRFWSFENFDGHFFGPSFLFLKYNSGGINIPLAPFKDMKDNRYEGTGAGVGFVYGYQFPLGERWNLELSLGVSYIYLDYEKYECRSCGKALGTNTIHWFGPTNANISFIYLINKK